MKWLLETEQAVWDLQLYDLPFLSQVTFYQNHLQLWQLGVSTDQQLQSHRSAANKQDRSLNQETLHLTSWKVKGLHIFTVSYEIVHSSVFNILSSSIGTHTFLKSIIQSTDTTFRNHYISTQIGHYLRFKQILSRISTAAKIPHHQVGRRPCLRLTYQPIRKVLPPSTTPERWRSTEDLEEDEDITRNFLTCV